MSPGTTTLDWYGCATFRLTIGGLVVFLDAYIDRVPGAPGIAVSGGERVRLSDDVVVGVFPSLHSCVWSQTAMHGPDAVCIGDLGLTHQEREARMAGLARHFGSLGADVLAHLQIANQGAKGDGGALVYVFETPDGSILYQDTSGHWSGILHDLRPDLAILAAAGRGNVDGEPIQGTLAQFVARQARLLNARRVILCHHDDWLPGFSTATDTGPIREELGRWLPGAQLTDLAYLDGHRAFAR